MHAFRHVCSWDVCFQGLFCLNGLSSVWKKKKHLHMAFKLSAVLEVSVFHFPCFPCFSCFCIMCKCYQWEKWDKYVSIKAGGILRGTKCNFFGRHMQHIWQAEAHLMKQSLWLQHALALQWINISFTSSLFVVNLHICALKLTFQKFKVTTLFSQSTAPIF